MIPDWWVNLMDRSPWVFPVVVLLICSGIWFLAWIVSPTLKKQQQQVERIERVDLQQRLDVLEQRVEKLEKKADD